MEQHEVDVAVIGAGLGGIAFARFYLDTHPQCRLTVLEKDPCIGGVWSMARVFDAFWAQSPLRMTSFSDVTLQIPEGAPSSYDTFEARHVTQYLEEYIDNHVYNGKPLRSRIRLNAEVSSVEKNSNGWILSVGGAMPYNIQCIKLAVASGLTSLPNMPKFFLSPDWRAPILHHRDFGSCSKEILAASSSYKNVSVLGGGKSAVDMVYASLKAGKNVSWIIRKSGEGPGIFMNPEPTGMYRNSAEAVATQRATALNPSGFRPMLEWAQTLHKSASERATLESKLFAVDHRFKAWANYRGREGALPSFRELEPKASFFWNIGPLGLIQHNDFWELASQKVNVYRSDISDTNTKSIILDDGREVPTDVLLCGTGWDARYPFLSSKQEYDLGLPHEPCEDPEGESQKWKDLMELADHQIVAQYPILACPPPGCKPVADADLTPARLYQGVASLTDDSIVFLGRAKMSNNFRRAEAQAIWATAYWDGYIKLPPSQEAQREVAYMNAFSRRRYPSRGVDGLNFHTDLVWYTDRLLCEAGLRSHRKGWWDDWDEPCLASDFKDCKDEYLTKYGLKQVEMSTIPA